VSTKQSIDDAYAAGSQAAANGDDGVCRADGDEYRAFKDGYYHTKGQIDNANGSYNGFTLTGWLFGNSKDDQANLDAYNAGHTAESRGKRWWWD
jgi:hypothetical protein